MKNALLGISLAILALFAWLGWPVDEVVPRAGDAAVRVTPPATASAATDSSARRSPDEATEPVRLSVDQPTGLTEARVTCVWAKDGEPAPAIPVVAYRIESKACVGPVAMAATDAAGVVMFRRLMAGEHEFQAVGARARATIALGVSVETTLMVPERAVVRGIVIDATSAPVAGAEVAAEVAYIPQRIATTGIDGRFRVRLASRGRMWACKEGHGPSRMHRVEGDVEDLVLRLETAGGSIHGVVLDPDGRAVPRASVAIAIDLVTGRGRPAIPHLMLEADARGEFTTAQVPRGPLIVFAHADGFAFGQQDTDTAGADARYVVVRLRRTATIHGVLIGGNNGDEPLVGKPVSVHRQRDLPGLLSGTSDMLTRLGTATDNLGRYRLTGIAPGRVWIMASDPQGAPVHHNVLLREGEQYEWNPDLSRPSGVIRGTLQGPDGVPLAGFHVRATRVDVVQMKQELSRAESDADGRFELRELRPFPHTLTVHASDQGEPFAKRTEAQPDSAAFVWRLTGLPSQSGAIVGRVLSPDGHPVARASCRARSEGISRNSEPLPGSNHGFRIPNVLPGTWDVVGQVEGYGSFDLGRHAVAPNAQVDLGTHSLPPLGALRVRLKGQGFEPANIELAVEQVEGGTNKTAVFQTESGALRSPALPPGRYRLLARGANFAPITRDVTIPAGSDSEIDLEAEPTGAVAIEFVPQGLDDREWLDYLTFELRDAGGKVVVRHAREVRGAPTATITVGLLPGIYTIEGSANQSAYRSGKSEFLVPSDATGRRDVTVMLEVLHR